MANAGYGGAMPISSTSRSVLVLPARGQELQTVSSQVLRDHSRAEAMVAGRTATAGRVRTPVPQRQTAGLIA